MKLLHNAVQATLTSATSFISLSLEWFKLAQFIWCTFLINRCFTMKRWWETWSERVVVTLVFPSCTFAWRPFLWLCLFLTFFLNISGESLRIYSVHEARDSQLRHLLPSRRSNGWKTKLYANEPSVFRGRTLSLSNRWVRWSQGSSLVKESWNRMLSFTCSLHPAWCPKREGHKREGAGCQSLTRITGYSDLVRECVNTRGESDVNPPQSFWLHATSS